MSMKQELETWVSALAHYDRNEFEESIKSFQPIADTSKILFNCGVIRATLGEHSLAVQYYQRAIQLDMYLAIAYFQAGVSNFLLGDFEEALANFNDTLLYLRGNQHIDYEQLGLKFKLYSCEALFNRGLCYVYLQAKDAGLQDMIHASKEKVVDDHSVIDDAIKDQAEGYTVFSIPVGVVFRPSEAKVKNVRARDYLGKTHVRLVASGTSDHQNTAHKRMVSAGSWTPNDRPSEQLSYAATNLVRPNLHSRARQQSEPPLARNIYPPTPPPESEKPAPLRLQTTIDQSSRAAAEPSGAQSAVEATRSPVEGAPRTQRSLSATRSRPQMLELGIAAFEKPAQRENARRAPPRSSSERPAERRRDYEHDRRSQETEHRSRQSRERLFGSIAEHEDAGDVGMRLSRENSAISEQSRRSAGRPTDRRRHPKSIVEEDETEEVIDDGPAVRNSGGSGGVSPSVISMKYGLRSLRIKVHYMEDTRYIIMTPPIYFRDFLNQIIKKFQIRGGVKVRTKDEEGDLITMGDEEDLNLAIQQCKDVARREGADVGKMEIWAQGIP